MPNYLVPCRFPYNPLALEVIKSYPGCSYDTPLGIPTWYVPAELVTRVNRQLQDEISVTPNWVIRGSLKDFLPPEPILHAVPYYVKITDVHYPYYVVSLSGTDDDPSIRSTYYAYGHFPSFPDWTNRSVRSDVGYTIKNPYENEIWITCLDQFRTHKAKKFKELRKDVRKTQKRGGIFRGFLSHQINFSDPARYWPALDLIYPGRFGTYWAFVQRYCDIEESRFGRKVGGVREDRLAELEMRIRSCVEIPVTLSPEVTLSRMEGLQMRESIDWSDTLDDPEEGGVSW